METTRTKSGLFVPGDALTLERKVEVRDRSLIAHPGKKVGEYVEVYWTWKDGKRCLRKGKIVKMLLGFRAAVDVGGEQVRVSLVSGEVE